MRLECVCVCVCVTNRKETVVGVKLAMVSFSSHPLSCTASKTLVSL